MSHDIDHTIGRAAFAYAGAEGAAWHGLGRALTDGASIDTWIEEAGLTYGIKRAYVRYATGRGQAESDMRTDKENVVLFRDDTGDRLGIVSSRYKVVQPREVVEFFRALCEQHGWLMSTAGALKGGSRYYAAARMGLDADIGGGDYMHGYALISTSADGSMATTVKHCLTRVVCANTLAIAMSEQGRRQVKVSHRSRFDANAAREGMGLQAAHEQVAAIRRMAAVKLDTEQVAAFVASVINPKAVDWTSGKVNGEEIDKARESRGFASIMSLFAGGGRGAMLDTARGTVWGALGAVIEYVDHHAQARSDENRFASAHWGPGAQLKDRARDIAAKLAISA